MKAMVEEADRRIALPKVQPTQSVAARISEDVRNDCQELKKGHRQPELDWSFEIALIPAGNCLFGLHYTEQRSLRDELFKLPGIEPYPYWNNTDPPKGVSNKRWKERGHEWDWALGDGPPAAKGFTYQIAHPEPWLFPDEHDESLQPSTDDRIRRTALTVAMSRFWTPDLPQEDGFREVLRIERWVRDTEDGRKALGTISAELAALLPDRYRLEDFRAQPELGTPQGGTE
jgi:hypothetical protein